MSFLSRKPARPGGRGRDDEYDDYDGYAADGYQNNDDDWSPGEYFSPEGIKGRWAGEHPDGRSGGRGRRDNGRGDAGPAHDSRTDDFDGADYGGGQGYQADEFASGAYDLPEGTDEDRPDRSRRRRKDREDRGERTGILRLRRDRGEDIWPDDGISDEDYWASVAADRPLNAPDSPPGDFPGAGASSRPATSAPRPGTGAADSRFSGEQHGATGRLGPPPGLAGDYKPGAPGSSGGGSGQPGGSGRTSSGPMPARPGTGPTPTVGVTASRPPAGRSGMRQGPAHTGPGSNGFPQPAARPSFQPNGYQSGGGLPGGGSAGGRQQDRGDWGDRTERIERVNASGYPDPRPAGRSQGPGSPAATGSSAGRSASGPLGPSAGHSPAPSGAPGPAAPGRGRSDSGGWRAADRREPERRDPGRDQGREAGGAWSSPGRSGAHARVGADDDPLTSKAYSRSAIAETDGRSYRAAARRSQAQAKLTEQAETFITGHYQQSSQYQAGRGGEYWQYVEETQAQAAQAPAGRYPAPGGQLPGSQQAQPGRGQAGPGHGPGPVGQPSRGNGGQPAGFPGGGLPGGQYEAGQPRPSQPQSQHPQSQHPQSQHPQSQHPQYRQHSQAQPAGAGPSAGSAGSSGTGQAGGRPSGSGGLNPYDTGVTGSYPYSSRPYPAWSAPGAPAQDAADDWYYRPSPSDQSQAGHGYPAQGDRRR